MGGWLFHPPKKILESGSEVTLIMSPQNHQRTPGVTSQNPFGGWVAFPPTHPPKKNFESGSEVTLMMSPQNHQRTTGVTSHNPFGGWVGGFPTNPPTEKKFRKWFRGDIDDVTPEPPKNHCDSKILIYQLTNWRTGNTVVSSPPSTT